MTTYINVYRLSDEYGGPEEGGWWYTAGESVASLRVEDGDGFDVSAIVDALRERYPDNGNRRSVLYEVAENKPTDYLVTVEDHVACPFPLETPRYE